MKTGFFCYEAERKETARLEKRLQEEDLVENWITLVDMQPKRDREAIGETHLLIIGMGNENRQSSTTTGTGLIVRGACIGGAGI